MYKATLALLQLFSGSARTRREENQPFLVQSLQKRSRIRTNYATKVDKFYDSKLEFNCKYTGQNKIYPVTYVNFNPVTR